MIHALKRLSAAAMLLAAPLAFAQGQAQPPGTEAPPAAPAAPVSDAQVNSFANAFGEIRDIQIDYSQRLQQVEDQAKAQQLQQAAQEEMVAAVQDAGLTIEEYNALAQRIDQDEQLRARVLEKAMP